MPETCPGPGRDVMLAFCHPGEVKTEFMLSVISACYDGASRVGELREFRTGPAMAQARNQVSRIFLESGLEWLWMCDSDMIFSARTLPALLAAADPTDRPVVGALCFIQTGPYSGEQVPNMYRAIRHGGDFIFESYERFPLGELVQVGATGGACLLIHRDVFAKIAKAAPDYDGLWWAELVVDRCLFGEDFSFCMRCAQAKIPVHVHTGVEVGHTKAAVIGRVSP